MRAVKSSLPAFRIHVLIRPGKLSTVLQAIDLDVFRKGVDDSCFVTSYPVQKELAYNDLDLQTVGRSPSMPSIAALLACSCMIDLWMAFYL